MIMLRTRANFLLVTLLSVLLPGRAGKWLEAELASIERNHYISIPVRGYGDSSIPVQCSSDNIPGDTGHWCPLVL